MRGGFLMHVAELQQLHKATKKEVGLATYISEDICKGVLIICSCEHVKSNQNTSENGKKIFNRIFKSVKLLETLET